MANSYLVQLTPNDGPITRKLAIQQWCEAVSQVIRSKWRSVSPASGNFLIDTVPDDVPKTTACADVAWLSSAAS